MILIIHVCKQLADLHSTAHVCTCMSCTQYLVVWMPSTCTVNESYSSVEQQHCKIVKHAPSQNSMMLGGLKYQEGELWRQWETSRTKIGTIIHVLKYMMDLPV